jgi:hypothetical protein
MCSKNNGCSGFLRGNQPERTVLLLKSEFFRQKRARIENKSSTKTLFFRQVVHFRIISKMHVAKRFQNVQIQANRLSALLLYMLYSELFQNCKTLIFFYKILNFP